MNNRTKLTLWIVMAVAMVLVIVCSVQYLELNSRLKEYEAGLSESRAKWEGIASEKEALLEVLNEKQKELRETELSYNDSVQRAEEIRKDIETLNQELEALKQQ